MNMTDLANPSPGLWLVLLLILVLILASAIGQGLRAALAPDRSNPVIEALNERVAAWWAMVILLSLSFLAGRAGVVILFAICSFAALREFLTLTKGARGDHWSLLLAFYVVLPLQYFLIWRDWYGLYAIFIPVYVFLMLPVLSALRGGARDFLTRIAETQWALMLAVYCASHVPALINLQVPGYAGRAILLIAFLIFVVQLSDVMQHVWSRLLGRRPVAPAILSGHTVEGVAFGSLTATAAGAALWWITPFNPWQAALIAFALSLAGFSGTLVMAAIKRDRGARDWGMLMPGLGGMIDRLDSVLFAAPILLHLTRYFFAEG